MKVTAIFKGRAGIGAKVQGEALVASDGFSARYDLDRSQGIFSRPTHQLAGQSYVGKILVLDIAKGGVASAWMLHEMMKCNKAPLALVLNKANPVLAQGAAFGRIPLIDRFDVDITQVITTGDWLAVDPGEAIVSLLEQE